MALHDDLRSRIVSWLKILLPLTALGLLSTLFLLSRTVDTNRSIPTSRADLESRTGTQQITAPSFAGVTEDGHALSFVAQSAQIDPEQAERVLADNVVTQIDLLDGGRIDITALAGNVHDGDGVAILTGDVVLTSSTGYRIETEQLTTRMREIAAESTAEITGEGPPGRLDAGKMSMTTDAQTGEVHLLFTNGVKLIYDPQNQESP
ncbi:MAG: LPS export ABC transporter periplasmic protein LptC [Rhodobacterales bacterium]